MKSLAIYFGIVLCVTANISFSESLCSEEEIFKKEMVALSGFIGGSTDSVSAFIYDGKFLPKPNRFISRAPSDRAAFSSAVLPPGGKYFECDINKIPRGMLEVGLVDDCEFCKKQLSYKEIRRLTKNNYTLAVFVVESMNISVIYSSVSYIQLIDNNTAMAELWWKVLIEEAEMTGSRDDTR